MHSSVTDRVAGCAAGQEADCAAASADADGEQEAGSSTATNDYAGTATFTFFVPFVLNFFRIYPVKKNCKKP
jgi:hypothetical protein